MCTRAKEKKKTKNPGSCSVPNLGRPSITLAKSKGSPSTKKKEQEKKKKRLVAGRQIDAPFFYFYSQLFFTTAVSDRTKYLSTVVNEKRKKTRRIAWEEKEASRMSFKGGLP